MAHPLMLITSLSSIVALALFKPRRLEHLLFAILATSLLLLAIGQLMPTSLVIEQQLIALGTFATCNVFWLLAHAMFRKGKALTSTHYLLAGIIALLILVNRSIDVLVSLQWLEMQTAVWLERSLGELLKLLSSGVILLAFWEAIRGYSSSSKDVKKQKWLFAGNMLAAVIATRVVVPGIPLVPEESRALFLIVRSLAACCVLASTFVVLWWQFINRQNLEVTIEQNGETADDQLLTLMNKLMEEEKLYLNSELKMMDVATALNQPEYKISRVLREKTSFDNFNHYVNYFRIEKAKQLLQAKYSKEWTILVISMESGFASLATFNRVFKGLEGCTPNQFRKQLSVVN